MKAITESVLRDELRDTHPDIYYIKAGCILTPAAREYLQQEKIRIAKEGEVLPPERGELTEEQRRMSHQAITPSYKSLAGGESVEHKSFVAPERKFEAPSSGQAKFVDFETGAFYEKKPETMTHLYDNVLVKKDHERIYFRGKLDSVQALIVFAQAVISQNRENKVVEDLGTVLNSLREIMRADVLNDECKQLPILGMTYEEIHEMSHNPMKFFSIKQCKLPDYQVGQSYALLNMIRANIRETEVAAAKAFTVNRQIVRPDIIESLNRLSSAMHVMMCKYDAGQYKEG